MLRQTGTGSSTGSTISPSPQDSPLAERLEEVGYTASGDGGARRVAAPRRDVSADRAHRGETRRAAIKVESVADFLAANGSTTRTVQGSPLAASPGAAFEWQGGILRRRAARLRPASTPSSFFGRRSSGAAPRRSAAAAPPQPECEDDGFDHALRLIHEAAGEVGVDRACDLFFAAEREYWQSRNRAAQRAKARQDRWAWAGPTTTTTPIVAAAQHFPQLIACSKGWASVPRAVLRRPRGGLGAPGAGAAAMPAS